MPVRTLTVSQAAEFLGVSEKTVRRWDNKGILPAERDPANDYRRYSEIRLAEFRRKRELVSNDRTQLSSVRPIEFRFIDLFAGIGGLRLPFEDLGGHCVFSSEIDRFACQTYEANFGEAPQGDITKIASKDVPGFDVLLGGFPCQPFSLAGVSKLASLDRKHGFDDPTRGTLFFEIKRLIAHHRPRAFLLENVKHLRNHDGGKTYAVIRKSLEDLGYHIHDRVLDACHVVPQHRERIFIVGFDRDVPFDFPRMPTVGPSLKTILLDHDEVDEKYTLSDKLWQYLQDYAEKHRKKGNGFGYSLSGPDDVARTLSARYHKDGSEILVDRGRGKNPRRLTPPECKRLMGFPEDFKMPVSDTQAYRQLGNAVVVPLIQRIAMEVIRMFHDHYPPLTQTSLFDFIDEEAA
ncbi:MAG: DNA (cytosine-5-)-methyltransferase [Actinomycetota bacterium]